MKWEGRRQSDNVQEQGSSGGGMRGFGGFGKLGVGGIILVIIFSLLTGQNPLEAILGGGVLAPTENVQETEFKPRNEEEKQLVDMLKVVLADTEDVWHTEFKKIGREYREPKLVIYQDSVNSGCGLASSKMGPFYCGADEKVYIDVAFARDLRTMFAAEGDFPFVYVLAHEVGHHVQNQLGILTKVQGLRGRVSDREFNNEIVKLELQADYLAGVVAHYMDRFGYLDKGDVEEGMTAAAGVGDDRIQEMQGGRANPDTFQHGASEQRQRWFLYGYKYGDLDNANTFKQKDAKDL